MKENGINKIYTENEKDFKKIPGIKVINPLK
jgi:predicted nucleic acid-binding protein